VLRVSLLGEQVINDYRALTLSLKAHPVSFLRDGFSRQGIIPNSGLDTIRSGRMVTIAGLVLVRQRPGTAKGITFLLLEDEFGLVNIVIYPDLYERQRLEVRSTPMLVVEGKLQLANNNINIVAERLLPLENLGGATPPSHNGWDIPPTADVDLSRVQLMRIVPHAEATLTSVDISSITPEAHNYR
jgi:error-prone DNA polymerase